MKSKCSLCSNVFSLDDADVLFLDKLSPQFNGVKYAIPNPTMCSECRLQRRMAWRNERQLFHRKCSKTGKPIVSMFPPETEFPVYQSAIWWDEANDAAVFGQSLKYDRGIFEQMRELRAVVPRIHTFNYAEERMINSVYTNCAGDVKDCYLIFGSGRNEGCAYSNYINDCENCFDCFFTINSNSCYEGLDLDSCHSLFFSRDCKQCFDSLYLEDCRGCSESLCCVGLRQKKLHVLNQPVSKDEFLRLKNEVLLRTDTGLSLLKEFHQLREKLPFKYFHGDNNEDSTGDYLWHTSNCKNCYDTYEARDCRHCTWFSKGQDCMDFFAWGEAELCYEVSGGGDGMYGCCFTAKSFGCRNSAYLDMCVYCDDCFACVGLKRKKFHILNKEYSEEEYFKLLPQAIELMRKYNQWGEFFPQSDSPWGYNHSIAYDYFPLDEFAASSLGFKWSSYEAPTPMTSSTILANQLPADSRLVGDAILKSALVCNESKKPFRLTPQELDFYRLHGLPIPKLHPELRYRNRLARRNPRVLNPGKCQNCSTELMTTFRPGNEKKVFCEDCYVKALY